MFRRLPKLPPLPLILAGALALRIIAAVCVQHHVEQTPGRLCLVSGDPEGYWALARHLDKGEDFAIYEPPRYVERMPGFPLVLAAGIKILGERVLWIRFFLACLGTAACGLVFWLTRELIDSSAGLIACVWAAISPTFVVLSVLLLSETVFAAGLLAGLVAFAKLWRAAGDDGQTSPRRQALVAFVAGVLCGAATLVRPTWLLAAPAFAALYLLNAPHFARRLAPAGLLLAGFAIPLAPWAIRNYRVTGHFIVTTLWVGPSLYDGLSPQATGASDMRFIEEQGFYTGKRPANFEYEADRHYRRAALEFVKNEPLRTLELGAKKLLRFLNPFPNSEQFGRWSMFLGIGFFESGTMLLAIAGLWRFRKSWFTWLLSAGPFLYFAAVHLVFVGSVRYRLPAEYALLALTAVGCRRLFFRRSSAARVDWRSHGTS